MLTTEQWIEMVRALIGISFISGMTGAFVFQIFRDIPSAYRAYQDRKSRNKA